MNERPVICSCPMVQAIFEKRKTQFRRVVELNRGFEPGTLEIDLNDNPVAIWKRSGCLADVSCPFGQPGDLLWVRETWANWTRNNRAVWYRASNPDAPVERWRPSIHMPKKYCRLWLRVTDVRVEGVQEIACKAADLLAEGIVFDADAPVVGPCEADAGNLVEQFSTLWDSINAKRGFGWESNPWVWVVSFETMARGGGAT